MSRECHVTPGIIKNSVFTRFEEKSQCKLKLLGVLVAQMVLFL